MIAPFRSTADISILIPAYGGADKLRNCLLSLGIHAPSDCDIFVLDDGTPDESIAECCRSLESEVTNLRYVRSAENRGFVATCNWGWAEVARPLTDILLLNSDTEVTTGFLEEMCRVLYLHERHGVVTPRSNNATIFSIPPSGDLDAQESYRIWKAIHRDLPDYRLMPTAVGFCMLIKSRVLERFGLFDEIYSPGYNEENDFVCRINRCGYSVVAANHAFVFHYESSTFGSRRASLERAHRRILLDRFPEYERKVAEYFASSIDPVEKFSILRTKHRPSILFDLFHLPAKHSGTSEFALNLLREVYPLVEEDFDLVVGLSEVGRFFASDLNGYRIYEDRPTSKALFDLVFKPSQIFTWNEFRRMHRLSPRLSFVLQDIIAVRCDYLTAADRKVIFQKTAELSDCVYTISQHSHSDFCAFFGIDLPTKIIYHGTSLGNTQAEFTSGESVLVMGNGFVHKGVLEAVLALENIKELVVLGGERPDNLRNDIEWLTSGNLNRTRIRELVFNAKVLVYPSHYEGFGLPIIDSLAIGKQVIALDSQVNQEVAALVKSDNLTLIPSLGHLNEAVLALLQKGSEAARPAVRHTLRRWKDVAEEYVASFRDLLKQEPNASKMRARQDILRLLDSAQHP